MMRKAQVKKLVRLPILLLFPILLLDDSSGSVVLYRPFGRLQCMMVTFGTAFVSCSFEVILGKSFRVSCFVSCYRPLGRTSWRP